MRLWAARGRRRALWAFVWSGRGSYSGMARVEYRGSWEERRWRGYLCGMSSVARGTSKRAKRGREAKNERMLAERTTKDEENLTESYISLQRRVGWGKDAEAGEDEGAIVGRE
ncbi:hypothetical protein Tco_0051961 [Tanacetum coccineum]